MNYKTDFHHWLATVTRTDSNFTCNLEVDFLPFATQGGANVQAQPDYAANTKVLTGFTSGIGDVHTVLSLIKLAENKGAFFSAVLAQIIATVRNEDVIDDGNLLGKIVQMWQMLLQHQYFIDGGVSNALLINNPVSPAGALTFEVPQDGTEIDVRINVTNTGPSTLDWMGIQTVPIIHPDGLPLTGSEMQGGSINKLVKFGSSWLLLTSALEYTVLGGNTQFFVNASTGNDNNTGFSSGSAWATLQHAWNVIQNTVNLNGFSVTVNCTGAFTAGINAVGTVTGFVGSGSLTFLFASGSDNIQPTQRLF